MTRAEQIEKVARALHQARGLAGDIAFEDLGADGRASWGMDAEAAIDAMGPWVTQDCERSLSMEGDFNAERWLTVANVTIIEDAP